MSRNLFKSLQAETTSVSYGCLRQNSPSTVLLTPVHLAGKIVVIHALNQLAGYEPKRKGPTYRQQQAILARPRLVRTRARHLDGYERLRRRLKSTISRQTEKNEITANHSPLSETIRNQTRRATTKQRVEITYLWCRVVMLSRRELQAAAENMNGQIGRH